MPKQDEQALTLDRDLWFGKMFPEHSASTGGQISRQSLRKHSEWWTQKPPIFLYLSMGGLIQDVFWQEDAALRGEYLTRSFGAFPSADAESVLSQILEVNALPKYYLSAKACRGILNRAKRRGKELPEMLRIALEQQSVSLNEPDVTGGGKGILIQNEQTGTLSTMQNQSVCYPDTARTLSARYDSSPCVDRGQEFVCYSSHDQDARYNPLGNTSETVSAKYGTGGGNMPIVLFDCQKKGTYGTGGVASTMTAHEAKEGNDIVCAVDCRNGTESEINGTLQAKESGGTSCNLNNVCRERYIVRRLTPLECERLQGYPDGWTDIGEWTDSKGKRHRAADAPRYKALGNSIALPSWFWVLSRLNEYCEEKTMASLFDGIGGFPLIWEYLNGNGSAVWCSEIEEFPIAVTKARFPE